MKNKAIGGQQSVLLALDTESGPLLGDEHQKRIENHGKEIRKSIDAGEVRFLRDQRYDAAIAFVLPELLPLLDSAYGIQKENKQVNLKIVDVPNS